MRRILVAAALAVATLALAAGPAAAGGNSTRAPGKNKDLLILYYTVIEPAGSPTPSGTVTNLGQAISGGYYGNTYNAGIASDAPANGHGVTAPLAPGPASGGFAGVIPNSSIGDAITGNPSGPSGKTDPNPC